MPQIRYITTPTNIKDLNIDALDESAAQDNWRAKADRLQKRRWRRINQDW